MDMIVINVSDVSVQEGDFVEIFGKENPIENLAKASDTIPYEIISRIAPRVKRIIVSAV